MAEKISRQAIADQADIHTNAPTQTVVDRTFELPNGLYVASAALYLGFMGVMAVGFGNPVLVIPIAVIVFTIIAGFGLPTIWTRLGPDQGQDAKTSGRFAHEGIITAFGHLSANGASVQVLILPVLIFLWGIAAVIIAALV